VFTSELFRSGSGDLLARRAYILHALNGPPLLLAETLPKYITLVSINTTKSHDVDSALHSISTLCKTCNSSRVCRDLSIFRGVLYVICAYGLLALQLVELLHKYLSLVASDDVLHDLMHLSWVNG
jgi:hypothetical protein